MGADAIAVSVITVFWAVVGIVLPFVLGRGPNKGVIQTSLMLTAASCWLFWLLCYMHQMNPLIGPTMRGNTLIALKYLWDNDADLPPTPTTTTQEMVNTTTAASTM